MVFNGINLNYNRNMAYLIIIENILRGLTIMQMKVVF